MPGVRAYGGVVLQKMGGRKKKRNGGQGPGVLFADVAGVDEAKEELEEIVVSPRVLRRNEIRRTVSREC